MIHPPIFLGMNSKTWLLLLLFGAFWSMALAQFPVKRSTKTLRVIAPSGLNLRAEPKLGSKVLRKLPYGAEVILQEEGYELITVGWMTGHWAKVATLGASGYVFSPYLTHLPLPDTSPQGDCEQQVDFGHESLLQAYIQDQLSPRDSPEVVYELPMDSGELYRKVTHQAYEHQIEVVRTTFYESGSTALRVPQTDIYQLYALLEALFQACPQQAPNALAKPVLTKDAKGYLIQVQDGRGGDVFRIRQVDAATAELKMSSGV